MPVFIGDLDDIEELFDAWSARPEHLAFDEEQGAGAIGASNPSHGIRQAARRARRVVTSPAGIAVIAGSVAVAVGLVIYAARRGAPALFGSRPSPGPGRTAVIGDSIVAHSAGFVQYLDQHVPERSFTNFGIVGQGTESILSDLRNRVIGHGFDEVIIEGGANDLGRPDNIDYITSRLRTIVQEAKAAGLKVVLLPMIPMAQQARLIPAINSVVMSQGRSWGADVVVDTYSPLDDGRGGIISSYVTPDGIHPTREGQLVIGRAIQSRAYA
ncbi:MAG: SGNH/GDSL hydrolase family protein [Planctomycetota bacterium]